MVEESCVVWRYSSRCCWGTKRQPWLLPGGRKLAAAAGYDEGCWRLLAAGERRRDLLLWLVVTEELLVWLLVG